MGKRNTEKIIERSKLQVQIDQRKKPHKVRRKRISELKKLNVSFVSFCTF